MDEAKVMFSVSELKIVTAQHKLREAGIESFVINKKDSAYTGILGDIELYVDKVNEARAKAILVKEQVL